MRHGPCSDEYNTDPHLSNEGIHIVTAFPIPRNWKIKTLITSPKNRAVDTAKIILPRFDFCKLLVEDNLREISPVALDYKCHPDYIRASEVFQRIILRNLTRTDVLVISHRNLMTFCLNLAKERRIPNKGDNEFDKFCSILEVGAFSLDTIDK